MQNVPVAPSPAVGRIARLLRVLASAPERELTLAELARRAEVSKPTAHSLLLALTDEGFVVRAGAKPVYRLGPGLVELGQRAKGGVSLVDAVEPELDRLRAEHAVSCMAARIDGDEIEVVAARCVPHPFGYQVAAGARIPLHAPVGPVYVAWSASDVVARWFDTSATPLSPSRRQALCRDLAAVRRRGWSATVRDPRRRSHRHRELTPRDLDASALAVLGISAPLRSATGDVVGSLAFVGFSGDLSGVGVEQLAREVVDAATRASRRMGRCSAWAGAAAR